MRNVTIFHIWFGQHVGIILRKTPPKSLRFSPRFFFFKVSKQTLLPLLTHKLSLHEALLVCVRAKSLQLCPTLCDSMDCSPPGSSVYGILGKSTGVGCHFFLQIVLRLYVICPWFIYFVTGGLYLWIPFTYLASFPPAIPNHLFAVSLNLWISVSMNLFHFFFFKIPYISEVWYLSFSDWLHLA